MSEAKSTPDRKWYFIGGALSLIVGLLAIARPGLASIAIADLIGIFCIVSGGALLVSGLMGKAKNHRFFDYISALLRVIVGILLIVKVVQGVAALTLVLIAIFLAEGIVGILFSLRVRGRNSAWIWMLLNGIAALVLAGMLYAEFPSDEPWAIGLLFGLNTLFLGASLITFALAMPRTPRT